MRIAAAVFLLQAGLMLATAGSVTAAPVALRSGEHEGFSRIVVGRTEASPWTLRRSGNAYVFRDDANRDGYDDRRVFDFIPHKRISSLRALADGGLEIGIACACHAQAFMLADGDVVIDVADGAPDPGSPFEQADDPQQTTASVEEPAPAAADPSPPPVLPQHAGRASGDRYLSSYWPEVRPGAFEAARRPPETEAPAAGTADGPARDGPRAAEMQREVLEQMSRAAAQGLVHFETATEKDAHEEAPPPAAGADDPVAPPPGTPDRHGPVPLHIETSIDRDGGLAAGPPVRAPAPVCPDEGLLDIGRWGDDRPASLQIADARSGLVGEFDRPDPARLIALARLYLYLGFGAEARMTLRAFGATGEEALWADRLGAIEGGSATGADGLEDLPGCDGPAALWAALGSGRAVAADLNTRAVLRSFSALPRHLRLQLGPQLIEKLLAANLPEAAASVRDAISRGGPTGLPEVALADAEVAIATGDSAAGEPVLDRLARGNGPAAAAALVRAIELRLDRGAAVPPDFAATAGALGYELRHQPLGRKLSVLHVLALASTGDFASAFAELDRLPEDFARSQRNGALRDLFRMTAAKGDDWTLLSQFFAHRSDLVEADPDLLLRLDLADRLTGSGFDEAAASLLAGEASATARGRTMLAAHALRRQEPDQALRLLDGIDPAEAAALRGQALLQLGRPREAGPEFRRAGDQGGAGVASWADGDWAGAEQSLPEPVAAALRTLRPGAPEGSAPADIPAQTGELAAGRRLADEAREAGNALRDLLRYGTGN